MSLAPSRRPHFLSTHFAAVLPALFCALLLPLAAQPLDPDFNPNVNNDVFAVVAQPDGKILLGGNFTSIGGVARSRLARLNTDGSVDTSFNPGPNTTVSAIALQPDGRIILSGSFSTVAGVARVRIARVLATGALDTAFTTGADNSVSVLTVQPDGKILIGGLFTAVNNTPRTVLARLNADGSLDTAFNPLLTVNSSQLRIDVIVVQPDGKILIGGSFSSINGSDRSSFARLNANGTIDTSFTAYNNFGQVTAIVLQPNGNILIGGSFFNVGTTTRYNIARLNSAGEPDEEVGLIGPNSFVRSLFLQPDGKFIVGGSFGAVGSIARSNLARFNADGSFDSTFTHEVSGANGSSLAGVTELASPGPGQLVIGGTFATVSGQPRNGLARIGGPAPSILTPPRSQTFATDQPGSLSVTASGSTLTYQWLRNGTAIAGATSATLSLLNSSTPLAGSYSVIVTNPFGSVTSAPAVVSVDPNRTVYFVNAPASRDATSGTEVTLTVTAGGSAPLSYQWFKDGTELTGATSSTLNLGLAVPAQSGSYTVTVRDANGAVTSSPAVVTITGDIPYLVATLAGRLGVPGSTDGATASAQFTMPYGLAVDPAGNIYLADRDAHTIRKISAAGVVSTVAGRAGTTGSTDGAGTVALFNLPSSVVLDSRGNLFVADTNNNRIRRITPEGVVSTFAGGVQGNLDGIGVNARLGLPRGLAIDRDGTLYCTDGFNHTIRKITAAGAVTLLAGLARSNGHADGAGTAARFNNPHGIAVDGAGNLYVADMSNHVIRHVTPDGVVTTLAGTPGTSGAVDGPLANARFSFPQHLTLDPAGNLFVASTVTLRQISPTGIVNTPLGGSTTPNFADALGNRARFSAITGVTSDPLGNLYLSDSSNALVRRAVPIGRNGARLANLSVRTLAGTGADTLIVGFNLSGGTKPLLVRAIGPTLSVFGVSGTLADPSLQLDGSAGTLARNNDWHAPATGDSATIATASASVGAFALPAQSRDSALLQTLPSGTYTAQVGGGTGITLVEVYDLDPQTPNARPQTLSSAAPRLTNVSARTRAGSGAEALIVGFVVTGDAPRTVLLRAVGPTLAGFGVTGALGNPRLELVRDNLTVATNTTWAGASSLTTAFAQVGAFALPTDSRDAAFLVTLLPGAYTAQVTPASGAAGIVLVEIYDVP